MLLIITADVLLLLKKKILDFSLYMLIFYSLKSKYAL